MKKPETTRDEDLRPECDFAHMPGGVRGKYVQRYRSGTNLVLLEEDVFRAFPTDAAVNQALRALLLAASAICPARARSTRRVKPSRKPGRTRRGRGGVRS